MEEKTNVRIVIEAKDDDLSVNWSGRDALEVLGILELAKTEIVHDVLEHLKEKSRNIKISASHIDEGPRC